MSWIIVLAIWSWWRTNIEFQLSLCLIQLLFSENAFHLFWCLMWWKTFINRKYIFKISIKLPKRGGPFLCVLTPCILLCSLHCHKCCRYNHYCQCHHDHHHCCVRNAQEIKKEEEENTIKLGEVLIDAPREPITTSLTE